jgi:hypothetical protein
MSYITYSLLLYLYVREDLDIEPLGIDGDWRYGGFLMLNTEFQPIVRRYSLPSKAGFYYERTLSDIIYENRESYMTYSE